MTWHILPDDDLVAHVGSADCVCGPSAKTVDDVDLIVHETLEEREDDDDCSCPWTRMHGMDCEAGLGGVL